MMQYDLDTMFKITQGTKPKSTSMTKRAATAVFINDVTSKERHALFFWEAVRRFRAGSRALGLSMETRLERMWQRSRRSTTAALQLSHDVLFSPVCTHTPTSMWLRGSDEDKGTQQLLLALKAQLLNTNTREPADKNATVLFYISSVCNCIILNNISLIYYLYIHMSMLVHALLL